MDGLIFDCDGTLADTMPAHYISWQETLAPYGIIFPEDRFWALGGWTCTYALQTIVLGRAWGVPDVNSDFLPVENAFVLGCVAFFVAVLMIPINRRAKWAYLTGPLIFLVFFSYKACEFFRWYGF